MTEVLNHCVLLLGAIVFGLLAVAHEPGRGPLGYRARLMSIGALGAIALLITAKALFFAR